MFLSVLLLSGCNKEVEPTIVETVKIEEDYKSVLSYIEKNNIKLDEEVNRDKDGIIIDSAEADKKPWEIKEHVSVVHIIPGVKFGLNTIKVEAIANDEDESYENFIVVEGDLYNNNKKEVAYGIIGGSILSIADRDFRLSEDDKDFLREKNINFFDSTDTSLKFAKESSTNIKLYYVANISSKSLDLLKTVRFSNLNLDLLIRPQVYEEDRTEEDLKYLEDQRSLLELEY